MRAGFGCQIVESPRTQAYNQLACALVAIFPCDGTKKLPLALRRRGSQRQKQSVNFKRRRGRATHGKELQGNSPDRLPHPCNRCGRL
jgi:hypothetical protein